MNFKYLPIGSIVRLSNATRKVMVTGYNMETPNRPGKVYNYSGCIFPEGVLRSDVTIVFDHNQIEEIFFKGYENEEQKSFIEKITKK